MIVVDTNIISYFYISGERSHLAELRCFGITLSWIRRMTSAWWSC